MASEPEQPAKADSSVEQVLGEGDLSEDKRRKVEELIEEEEGATNRLGGWLGSAVIAFAVARVGVPPLRGSGRLAAVLDGADHADLYCCGRCTSAWCWR